MDPATFFAASRVVIVAGKGGVGKTTVTAALARAASLEGHRALIVEVEGKSGLPAKWFEEKGEGLFHLCFEVDDIDAALAELRAKGVKLITEQPKIGHGGCRIAFIDPSSTGNILIELAEMPEGHH